MAIIYTYPRLNTVNNGDLLLISAVNTPRKPTMRVRAEDLKSYMIGYTSYTALISQVGAAAPTAIVLKNDTGFTFTWGRTAGGVYTLTANGNAFTANKTIVFNNSGVDIAGGYTPPYWERTSDTEIVITTGGVDTAIDNGDFEVRIYS